MDEAPRGEPGIDGARVAEAARAAGLTAGGTASVGPSAHGRYLDAWLARGAHAGMAWMARTAAARRDLTTKWDWARGALVGALSYLAPPEGRERAPGLARHVARYARGADYHDLLPPRLARWADAVGELAGRPLRRAVLVDASAVLERELAVRAGLGWFGKNTCLIGPRGDSWRVLGVVLVDLELPDSGPPAAQRCGTCTRCLDACPTGAITEPYFVDANRCLSYLTIEHRGPIPAEFHGALGDWLFGCDVCQEVCPWNRRAVPEGDPGFAASPALAGMTLAGLLRLDDAGFRALFRGTPLARPKRAGLLRNALLVAANRGDAEALAEVPRLAGDPDPVIRETARAIRRVGAR